MTYPVAMRGINEDSGEYLGPSRKQNRREALEVLSLADDAATFSQAIGDSFKTFGFAQ